MKNYNRHISILPSMSEVFEKLINRQMNRFLREVLDPRVAEYRHGYKCQDVLLRLTEEWKNALENRKCVGPVQAFDCLLRVSLRFEIDILCRMVVSTLWR